MLNLQIKKIQKIFIVWVYLYFDIFNCMPNNFFSKIINPNENSTSTLLINLKNYRDEQFYGFINIDNIERKVIFDTGSNLVWVQGRNKSKIFSNNCKDFKTCLFEKLNWNNLKDSAYQIKYGTGMVFISSKQGDMNLEFENKKNITLNSFMYGISLYEEKEIFEKVN
jgi:hypothetical protein